ncbi:MAG: iron-containing alcohol dehydrogenase [Deltaproteobacteria bacterium]|nr:iron-containing alcohol dehydrogenase [Deltaproteobacteria bacterium]
MAGLTFRSAGEIVFGRGTLERIGGIAAGLGSRAMVVRGGRHLDASRNIARLEALLGDTGVEAIFFTVRGEPDVEVVDGAAEAARGARCDLVIGIGGGSALDAAKAVAGLLTSGGSALDYMEVVGRGRTIDRPAAPLVAVPTTAGTGTEVTKNAVITSREKSFKASMRSPHLVPAVALVDPALTDFMPRRVTAATGLDALTQLVEAYVTRKANPLTDALALQGITLASRSLVRACDNGDDHEARDDMALAALLSGLCLANAGLGAVHGFAAPLGAAFPVPHGVACAALLPHVMEANVAALRREDAGGPALARYDRVAVALGAGDADGAVALARELVQKLEIPPLSRYGIGEGDVAVLVERARQASSMKGNPVALGDKVLADVLRRGIGA